MVSDSELIIRLREFLRNSDLNTTTNGIVRRSLEEEFGVDLSDKKQFIREQVDLFVQSEHDKAHENDSDEPDDKPDDDDDDDGEASNGKGRTGSNKRSEDKEVKKRGGGFCKLCSLSPQLQELLGVPEMARTEVVKQMWKHIRGNNLQDPSNRKIIVCDEPLKALFGVNSIDMFQMNKALSKHIWPLNSNDVIPAKSTHKEKTQKQHKDKTQKQQKEKPQKRKKQEKEEDSEESEREEKRQKKGKSGFLAPLQLSDALVTFLGTGENALSRSDAVKRMWNYIKQNDLQDPSDKRRVNCDEKLKELFDVDSFIGFTVSKLLAPHFVKTK